MKIIFKHSYRCPISRRAKREVDDYLKETKKELEYEFVDVIGDRERSNEIADQHGIQHESPQIIILDDIENVIWGASHGAITKENIKIAVSTP